MKRANLAEKLADGGMSNDSNDLQSKTLKSRETSDEVAPVSHWIPPMADSIAIPAG